MNKYHYPIVMSYYDNNKDCASQYKITYCESINLTEDNSKYIYQVENICDFSKNDDVEKLINYYNSILKVIKIIWNSINIVDRTKIRVYWDNIKDGPFLNETLVKLNRMRKDFYREVSGIDFGIMGGDFYTSLGGMVLWRGGVFTASSYRFFEDSLLNNECFEKSIKKGEDAYFIVKKNFLTPLDGFYLNKTKRSVWKKVLAEHHIINDDTYYKFLEYSGDEISKIEEITLRFIEED